MSEELPIEFVRWFYYHRKKNGYPWKNFSGSDSIKIEEAYRARKINLSQQRNNEHNTFNTKLVVREDLFLVDIDTLMCEPIFWSGNKKSVYSSRTDWCSSPIKRGIWFNKINWIPLDQELSDAIEAEHVKYVIPKLMAIAHEKKSNRRSTPISRGYNKAAAMSDAKPAITHLCFVVHGIGQQLASIRHECSKIRETCIRITKKYYSSLFDSGRRLEFIPVDWRSDLPLNHGTLNNITVAQILPLRSYINNCFVDILYYTSSYYRMEILRSLKWELMRQYNLFLQYNPHFLQTGGHVSVIAHSLGSVLMYDLLKENLPTSNNSTTFHSAMDVSTNEQNSFSDIMKQIEDTRAELYDLENKLISQVSVSSQRPYTTYKPRNIAPFRFPNSWKQLPQLANLFMIGSPLALFIAVNSEPGNQDWLTDNWAASGESMNSSFTDRKYSATDDTSTWNRSQKFSQTSFDDSNTRTSIFELNQTDPNALIPHRACKRIFNVFHSYDPIAYRIEPLLLKHYSKISPLVLPSVDSYFQKKNRVNPRAVSNISLSSEPSTSRRDSSPRVRFRLSNDSIENLTSDDSELGKGDSTLRLNPSESVLPLVLDERRVSSRRGRTTSNDEGKREATLRKSESGNPRSSSTEEFKWYNKEGSKSDESSQTSSMESMEETFAQKVYRRLSVVAKTTVYKQHQSRAMKLFSRYVVRRSSHVTNLESQTSTPVSPQESTSRLDYRVDYEWQKSFAPLAVLGAHNSYWNSKDLAFFIVYQLFGQPEPR